MPYIEVKTNKKLSDEKSKEISSRMGELITCIPGKTESWLMTEIEGDCFMTFAGSDAPCAMVSVSIFGKADKDAYDRMTRSVCDDLSSSLDIPADRIYVKYSEITDWGWNSRNF